MASPSFGSGAVAAGEQPARDGETAAAGGPDVPRYVAIQTRAYFIYVEEGGGDPDEHWARAEREVTDRDLDQEILAELRRAAIEFERHDEPKRTRSAGELADLTGAPSEQVEYRLGELAADGTVMVSQAAAGRWMIAP